MNCKPENHIFISMKEKFINDQIKQSAFKVLQMLVGLMNYV